jgi:hypothetical protein
MSLTDMFERMARERQTTKNKKPVPFSLAKLKAEAAMWMAPRSKFDLGAVVTAADMFIPVHHPNSNEVYIVLRYVENPNPMSDDVNKAYSAVLCDVEILRMDQDGDCVPYTVSSAFLRLATDCEIAAIDGHVLSKNCPHCGRDHSKDGDDEPSTRDVDQYDYAKLRPLAKRRSIDGFISEIPGAINDDEVRSGDADKDFRVFLNRSFDDIPTESLAVHMEIVGELLAKDFTRIYGELDVDTMLMYNDLLTEKRPVVDMESGDV